MPRNKVIKLEEIGPPNDEESQILDKAFNNIFSYNLAQNFRILPEKLFVHPHWADSKLQSWKGDLNAIKSQLDTIDIEKWQEHTSCTNRASYIMKCLRSECQPVLGTQAWFKFHEILGHFPELTQQRSGHFNSVHLCEAPGAFVASLQHFLVSRDRHKNWNWLASTLNPHHEGNNTGAMIDDDRFILGTYTNWCFGADETGDIMNIENIECIKRVCHERCRHEIHLVTSDGSIDCSNRPDEQESIVSQLIYCEVIAALCLLTVSGSAVIKMFTLFENSSVCIIFLLCCLFRKVTIIKPVTSKPGNSEVYVVALDFQGINEQLLLQLKKQAGCDATTMAIFDVKEIPHSFLELHYACCEKFYKLQTNTIESNLQLFNSRNKTVSDKYEFRLKLQFAKYYAAQFGVRKIESVLFKPATIPETVEEEHKRSHVKCRHTGSLASRQRCLQQPEELILSKQEYNVQYSFSIIHIEGEFILPNDDLISNWRCGFGKNYTVLQSSKFCQRKLLQDYLQLLNDIEKLGLTADDPVSVLELALLQIKCDEQQKTLNIFHSKESELIWNQIKSHKYNMEVSHCDSSDHKGILNSSGVILCGHLMASEKKDMDRIVNSEEEITDVVLILKKIRPGCHCLIATGPPLTRLHAGIFSIIYSCFSEMSVCCLGSSCTLFIIGWNFRGCPSSLEKYISEASLVISKIMSDNLKLLELIPMSVLYDRKFYDFIGKINRHFVQLRFNHLLRLQKDFHRTLITSSASS